MLQTTVSTNSTDTLQSTTKRATPSSTTVIPLITCNTANCSNRCENVKDQNAVCSCPDERMYLGGNNRTCGKYFLSLLSNVGVYRLSLTLLSAVRVYRLSLVELKVLSFL